MQSSQMIPWMSSLILHRSNSIKPAKKMEYGISSSNSASANGAHGLVLVTLLEGENKSIDTSTLRPERNHPVSSSEQITPTRKRKLQHDSSSSIDTKSTLPSSAARQSTHMPVSYHVQPAISNPVSSRPSGLLPYTAPMSPARTPSPRFIRTGPQLPHLSYRTPAPSPIRIATPQPPNPTLIVKLKVPTWFKATKQTPISQSQSQTPTSQVSQTPKESRTPASRATKCSTCGGIHTSTCLSNMDRLDEIAVHLSFLGTLTQAATIIAAEVREHFGPVTPPTPTPIPTSSASSSPITNHTNAAKYEDKTALKTGLERLLAEGQTWLVKARPLILEAAMREGNLEEGESLRGEIRRDGGVVRAGEVERYFMEARERILGGMRDGMACEEGVWDRKIEIEGNNGAVSEE